MVMTLCLLVYSVLEYKVHQKELKKNWELLKKAKFNKKDPLV